MNLYDYLTNYDVDITDTFTDLYKKLKVINDNGLKVVNLDSKHINMNEEGTFDFDDNYELAESGDSSNLITLTKLFLGSFYTKGIDFKDLSNHSTDRIIDNLDEISRTIDNDSYDREYFERVFDGEIIYYQDYLNKKEDKGYAYTKKRSKAYTTIGILTLIVSIALLSFLVILTLIK